MIIRKALRFLSKFAGAIALAAVVVILMNSALDIYNNFAYEKAILKDSPYGLTPLLVDPSDYRSADGFVKSGDFVYVEDWISAVNGKIVFAKVRSRLREGYVNKELLVSTNINFKPIISILLLMMISSIGSRKLYNKLSNHNIVLIKN
jgi:hypothetical protein